MYVYVYDITKSSIKSAHFFQRIKRSHAISTYTTQANYGNWKKNKDTDQKKFQMEHVAIVNF